MNTLISIPIEDLRVLHDALLVALSEYERREKNLIDCARSISDSDSDVRRSFISSAFDYHLSVVRLRRILDDSYGFKDSGTKIR